MGRLPTHYNGKRIMYRVPYAIYSECAIWRFGQSFSDDWGPPEFPIASLVHDVDKPFEIHRFIPAAIRLTAVDALPVPVPGSPSQMSLLQGADVRIRDNAKNVSFTNAASSIVVAGERVQNDKVTLANLVRGSAAQTWEWEDPYYMTRGEGFIVDIVDSRFQPSLVSSGGAVRYMIAFEGFLLVLEGESY